MHRLQQWSQRATRLAATRAASARISRATPTAIVPRRHAPARTMHSAALKQQQQHQSPSPSESRPAASASATPHAPSPPVPLPWSGPRVLGVGRVAAIAAATQNDMRQAGVRANVMVLEDTSESDAAFVAKLREQRWDAVLIGGGLSGLSPFVPALTPKQQARFEQVKSLITQHAPQAKLVLPTGPQEVVECLERELGIKLAGAHNGAARTATSTASQLHFAPMSASSGAAAWNASHASQYQSLNLAQRSLLLVGASVLSLLDPHRGDLVAAVSELTPFTDLPLESLRKRMQDSEEGRWLLAHKPRINSRTMPLQQMKDSLPPNSLGAQYARFMLDRGYSADERAHVKFVSDPELAYVLQRYREIHDLLHVLTGMPTSVMGELGQKAFESVHFRLAMPTLSATIAPPLTLSSPQRSFFYSSLWPWAKQLQHSLTVPHLIAMRYELYLHRDLQELRKEWGIIPTPKMPE